MDQMKGADFRGCELIINPSRFPQYVKILRKIVKRSNFARIVESRSREHFIESVRAFSKGSRPYLLVWGGDGTAHDTINTLLEQGIHAQGPGPAKAVGFLRGGSGNGIQDSYEVPFSLRRQLRSYAESTLNNWVEAVDLLGIDHGDHREFGQLFGLGFDVQVLETRNRWVKKRGPLTGQPQPGFLNYAVSTAATFFSYSFDSPPYQLDLFDGKYAYRGYRVNAEFPFQHLRRNTTVPMLEIGTRPYYGRLFKVCPDVVCNDGKIDLYIFNFLDRYSILKNTYLLWKGNHGKINKKLIKKGKPVIERYEISRCVLTRAVPFSYHIDGELGTAPFNSASGRYELSISVYPRSLRFLVPGTFYRKFHPDFSE
jgi:diacylglycerol kinase family enzyme